MVAPALFALVLLGSNAGQTGGSAPLGPPDGGQCFTDDTIRSHYGPDANASGRSAVACRVAGDGLWLDDWIDAMPENDMRSIATACKKDYPGDAYRQVHCAAKMVDDYIAAHFQYDSHSADGFRTYCRDHERAFRQVMDMIGNPKVSVSDTCVTIGGREDHVLNTVTITADDGQKYTYALDTGWYPDELNPMPGPACDYFQEHGGPGGDQDTLPPVDGVSSPQPTRNVSNAVSAAAVGSNVGRTSTTRAATTSSSAPTSTNAGFHH